MNRALLLIVGLAVGLTFGASLAILYWIQAPVWLWALYLSGTGMSVIAKGLWLWREHQQHAAYLAELENIAEQAVAFHQANLLQGEKRAKFH